MIFDLLDFCTQDEAFIGCRSWPGQGGVKCNPSRIAFERISDTEAAYL